MKTLLVYSTIGLSPSYSCGVGYVSAVLKAAGHDVSYRRLSDWDEIGGFCDGIAKNSPELIAFAATR